MSGKRLIARTGLAAVLGMLVFLVLSSVDSHATPIKPDVQKLLKQSQQSQKPFIPARAGWSEPVATASATPNPVLESMSDNHMRQEFRDTLATVATPDPWILLAMGMVIVLMRKLRSLEAKRRQAHGLVVLAREDSRQRLAA